MRKSFSSFILMFVIGQSLATSIYAQSLPREVAADSHVKIVTYDPNNVVILKGKFGYQTQITFAPNESVQNVSIGDSLAWQAVPVNNHLFVKPVAASKTNMTVLTNANSYNFQIDSTNSAVTPTYKLQFNYLDGGYSQAGVSNMVGSFDPEKLNWKYSYSGDRSLAPIEAFDNGVFTYFKFKNDGLQHLPAIFIVGRDNKENLINFHIQGNYIVINNVAKQFVMRDGNYVTSVFNEKAFA